MENYSLENLSFAYPNKESKALKNISFKVNQGEFIIVCGPSGCGKSTLLRHFKTCLTPHGHLSGEILFEGKPLKEADELTQANEIGFVFQSPENQIVTDKVWHELAFGLESLGEKQAVIRRRVAEVAAFFGIENWFEKNVNELSGGQKQLLSLASVMVMNPKILVLDEPTARLDPIAASDFLSLLGKINRELGITVILSEHRLEEAFPFATRVIVMEKGEIICNNTPKNVGLELKNKNSKIFLSMPSPMRLWAALKTNLPCPITVGEGSDFLSDFAKENTLLPLRKEKQYSYGEETVLSCKDIWFRYEKNSADILKGFSLSLKKGEFYAILGGNGAGKTTSLKVIASLYKAYRGKLGIKGRVGLLPQNPQALFVKKTVRDDLYEGLNNFNLSQEEKDSRVSRVVSLCNLSEVLYSHPYDISGGEQQRCALAKVLLTSPDILLLDEPTKGFDEYYKKTFASILNKLILSGVTVLMVSHDVSFCAEYAHRCGLFFGGAIVAQGSPREFFSGNNFYTTSANRLARRLIPQGVTIGDIIYACGGEGEEEIEIKENFPPLPRPPKKEEEGVKPLKLWRKITALFCGVVTILAFLFTLGIIPTPLFLARNRIYIFLGLLFSLTSLFFCLSRKSPRTKIPKEKKKLKKGTIAAVIALFLLIPLTILCGVFLMDNNHFNIIALLVLLECMLPFILIFEGRKPKARELVTIAVLCALGIAGRSIFFMLPQIKPVLALTIIAGAALGGETGFLVGALTMLASNMLFSQGPWTPWQMFAMGICGFLAGILFKNGFLLKNKTTLAVFGVFAAIVIYGGIMNPASAFTVSSQILNFKSLLAFYVSGLPMDLVHALGTGLFLFFGAEPMLGVINRIKTKYGLID